MPIGDHLADELSGLGKFAKQLGKLPPKVVIKDGGVLISKLMTSTIRGVFVHLFRNSLDHGIEAEAERRSQRKTPEGTINLEINANSSGDCTIVYSDDGQGLNLFKLRELLSMERQNQALLEKDIMESIFIKGMSTKSEVSTISGRGMGMDAVRSILQGKGGDVEICPIGKPNAKGFIRFAFKISINRERIYPHNLIQDARGAPKMSQTS